jgi:hypothetical protein
LRIKSTIITFSARSLTERSSIARSRRAASSPAGRGRVPLIGCESTLGPVRRRNSSGDKLATAPSGVRMKAAYGGSSRVTARQNASSGSPPNSASSRRQMFAWKMSPRRMQLTVWRTADRCSSADGTSRKLPQE